MRLRIVFAGERFDGSGEDTFGRFGVSGAVLPDSGDVAMDKSYPSYAVYYKGHWDGSMIQGIWALASDLTHTGEFEIWPEDGELSLDGFRRAEDVKALGAPSSPES